MPVDVQFEVRGINRVRNQLRAAASFHPNESNEVVERHTKAMAAMFRNKPYPARLPNQKYVRTFELRRRFRAMRAKAAHWRVINRTPYAVWVVKKGFQNIKYHAWRWWTIDDESEKTMPELTRKLSARLEQILERQSDGNS